MTSWSQGFDFGKDSEIRIVPEYNGESDDEVINRLVLVKETGILEILRVR